MTFSKFNNLYVGEIKAQFTSKRLLFPNIHIQLPEDSSVPTQSEEIHANDKACLGTLLEKYCGWFFLFVCFNEDSGRRDCTLQYALEILLNSVYSLFPK